MKIVAFAASNSRQSINKQLVHYATSLLTSVDIVLLDLNDFPLPIYSEDTENHQGIPKQAYQFLDTIKDADAFIISLAEHNGYYTAFYKNLLDWLSRVLRSIFGHKPVLYLATSPGPNGAATVLQHAVNSASYIGANLVGQFSLPSFYDNFDQQQLSIVDPLLRDKLSQQVALLHHTILGDLHDAFRTH